MVPYYMLEKVLDKIKEIIDIKKLDGTKILLKTDDKLPDYITLINFVTLIMCVIKDGNNFHPQVFLEEPLIA